MVTYIYMYIIYIYIYTGTYTYTKYIYVHVSSFLSSSLQPPPCWLLKAGPVVALGAQLPRWPGALGGPSVRSWWCWKVSTESIFKLKCAAQQVGANSFGNCPFNWPRRFPLAMSRDNLIQSSCRKIASIWRGEMLTCIGSHIRLPSGSPSHAKLRSFPDDRSLDR